MAFATKLTVLAVVLAIVFAIVTDEVSHSVTLSALVLLTVGFLLPLLVTEGLKRKKQ